MKVSVCMATYNGAKFIKEQVDSILNQEFKDNEGVEMEIVVSDDMSTDGTVAILKSYNDPRIRIYLHRSEHHPKYAKEMFACTENFGHAMSKAQGDYIFLADQDDVWYPWKMDYTLTMLRKHGGLCATGAHICWGGYLQSVCGEITYCKEPRFRLKRKNSLYGFCCGFTREQMKYFLPMPYIPHHDNFMMLIAQFTDRFSFDNRMCAAHRWTGVHNVSSKPDTSPFIVRNYYRAKMVLVALWRCLKYRIFPFLHNHT